MRCVLFHDCAEGQKEQAVRNDANPDKAMPLIQAPPSAPAKLPKLKP